MLNIVNIFHQYTYYWKKQNHNIEANKEDYAFKKWRCYVCNAKDKHVHSCQAATILVDSPPSLTIICFPL